MTKEELLVKLIQNIPYPHQLSDLDLSSEHEAIRFTWRRNNFRISLTGMVEECNEGSLKGSNIAILLEALIFPKHTQEK